MREKHTFILFKPLDVDCYMNLIQIMQILNKTKLFLGLRAYSPAWKTVTTIAFNKGHVVRGAIERQQAKSMEDMMF